MEQLALDLEAARGGWLRLIVAVALFAALAVTWWSYRRTWPPLPLWYRLLLGSLRALVVLAIGFLIFEPLVTLHRTHQRAERVAVLVDRSASMWLPSSAGGGPDSLSRLEAALAGWRSVEETQADFEYFSFGRELEALDSPAELSAGEPADRTDLASALEALLAGDQRSWDRLVLVTDGVVNSGRDPVSLAERLPPLEVVSAGEPPAGPDLALAALGQTRPAYRDGELELELSLALVNAGSAPWPERVTVELELEGRTVARELAPPAPGARYRSHTIRLPAPSPGEYWLRATLRPLEGEWTGRNNQRLARVTVREAGRKLLLVSDSPDWDLTFLGRVLAQGEDWELTRLLLLRDADGTPRVRRSERGKAFTAGPLPDREELSRAELLVLHGELERFGTEFLGLAAEVVRRGKPGLVLWPSGELDPARLPRALSRLLPFIGNPAALAPLEAPAAPSRLYALDRYGILSGSSTRDNLPPVERVYRTPPLVPAAEVLARTAPRPGPAGGVQAGPGEALLVARPLEQARTVLVLGQGLWRWHMQGQESGDPQLYGHLWDELARWLMGGGASAELALRPVREVFSRGEPVEFAGRLESAPADSAAAGVSLAVERVTTDGPADTVATRTLLPAAEGALAASLGVLPPGIYQYRASGPAGTDGARPEAAGEFAVERYSPELAAPGPDTALTAALARATGGGFRPGPAAVTAPGRVAADATARHAARPQQLGLPGAGGAAGRGMDPAPPQGPALNIR